MTRLPDNLPALLMKAGLTVVEISGWQTRCRPASTGGFAPVGVLNHHTGSADRIGDLADDLAYAKWLANIGRADLPAPLVQLALSLEGTVYVLAAGRANHAGTARASGSVASGDGKSLYVGIEWMLSGLQEIPPQMMAAGAILNAVLLEILGSSVQAVSCHYQTSVTGKWDIGDPHGISFDGHRVLDVPKFRAQVKRARRALNPPPPMPTSPLTFQHTSLQFSDSDAQMASDVERIFTRGRHILSGTEAGGEQAKPLPRLLASAALKHGYRFFLGKGDWVAVSAEVIDANLEIGYTPVIESEDGVGPHGDRGIAWMSWDNKQLGHITMGVGHYLTHGAKPGEPNYVLNLGYAEAIGAWARTAGAGAGIVFYAGDQNVIDRDQDTFFGSPLTSAWDETAHWENTGHGNIDVIASYDADGRVEASYIRARDDKSFHLHTDHYLVEAEYRVRRLKH